MQGAEVFEEGQVEQSFLVGFDRNLSDFKDEVQQEERDLGYFRGEEEEDIADLLGSNLDEIEILELVFLVPDEGLPVNIVVLAQQLQKLESSLVGPDAGVLVDLLIGGFRFEDILPPDILGASLVEIVVVDGGDREHVYILFFHFRRLLYVFDYEFSQFGDQVFKVAHDSVVPVFFENVDHVFLGVGESSEHVGNAAEENGVSKLNVFPDGLFKQFRDEGSQFAQFQLVLQFVDDFLGGGPVISLPLVQGLELSFGFVALIDGSSYQIQEEFLGGDWQSLPVLAVHLDDYLNVLFERFPLS